MNKKTRESREPEKRPGSELKLEKIYVPPELKEYGDLTSLTAGGSGTMTEGAKGKAKMKRP